MEKNSKQNQIKMKEVLLMQLHKMKFFDDVYSKCQQTMSEQYLHMLFKHVLMKGSLKDSISSKRDKCLPLKMFTERNDMDYLNNLEGYRNRKKINFQCKIPKVKTLERRDHELSNQKNRRNTAKIKQEPLRGNQLLPMKSNFFKETKYQVKNRKSKWRHPKDSISYIKKTLRNETISWSLRNQKKNIHKVEGVKPLSLTEDSLFNDTFQNIC